MSRVFISYRRSDSLLYADMLQEDIGERYGPDEVFRDLDDIGPGTDFVDEIEQALQQTEVMLVLIGPTWRGPEGLRRLHEDGDFVRMEIAKGLGRPNVRVIPVLVSGAKMPAGSELPEDLASLSRRNAFEIKDASWSRDRQDLLKELDGILGGPKPPWRKWAIAAAGVALAVTAAVVLAVVLQDDPGKGGATETGTTTTATATTTETEPPTVDPGALRWSSAGTAELGGDGEQRMTAVVNPIEGGVPALVAVGYEGSPGERDAAVWASAGGDTWTRVEDAGLQADGDQAMNSVAYVQAWATLVAGGTVEAGGDTDAALWESKNGRRWRAVPGLRAPGSDEQVNAVNGTRLGLTAAGSRRGDGTDGEDGAIWIYPQGGEPFLVTAGLGGRGDQRVNRVVQLKDDSFVAVGLDAGDAGVWRSDDGMSWKASDANPLEEDGKEEILDAVAVGSFVAAVGRAGGAGAAWYSSNGGNWKRVANVGDVFTASEGDVELLRVVAPEDENAPGFIAGGLAGPAAAVWVSSDGKGWRREPDSEGALGAAESGIEGLTAKELPAIAVGWSGADASVWLGVTP